MGPVFSLVTGVLYFLTFIGLGAGGGRPVANLAFTVAVILGWAWITALMLRTLPVPLHASLQEALS